MKAIVAAVAALTLCGTPAGPSHEGMSRAQDPGDLPRAKLIEVKVGRTPGHFVPRIDQELPAEEIVATTQPDEEKYKDPIVLIVRVNVKRARLREMTEVGVPLTKGDWEEIEKLIVDKKLLEWKPVNEEPSMDFGEVWYRIEGATLNSGKLKGPCRGWNDLRALLKHMGRLAARKVPKMPLAYFNF